MTCCVYTYGHSRILCQSHIQRPANSRAFQRGHKKFKIKSHANSKIIFNCFTEYNKSYYKMLKIKYGYIHLFLIVLFVSYFMSNDHYRLLTFRSIGTLITIHHAVVHVKRNVLKIIICMCIPSDKMI